MPDRSCDRHGVAFLHGVVGPQNAGGNRTPGCPGFRFGAAGFLVGPFFHAETEAHRFLKRKVAGRKDVAVAGSEHQIDFSRPWSDALDRDKIVYRLFRWQGAQSFKIEAVFQDGIADFDKGALLGP